MKIAEYQHVINLYKLLEKRFSKPKDIEDYKRLQKELYQLSLMAAEVGAEEELRDYQAYLQKWKAEFEKAIALAKAEKDDSERMPMRYEEVDPMLDAYKQYKSEGDGRKKGIHPKGHPKRKAQQAAIHANEEGRPRGAAHIENERFWDLSEDELIYIIKDASEAINANPTARKATQGPRNWSDQVNDAYTVLIQRDKHTAESFKSSLVKHTNEGHDPDVFHGVVSGPQNDIWFLGDDGEESAGELTYTANLDHDTGRYIVDPTTLDGNIDDEHNPGKLTDDMVGNVIDAEHDEYLEIAQEHADEHANERDSKYAQGESISSAVNAMRNRFDDYEQDPSNRWEQYEKYSNQRRQISQRAKELSEFGIDPARQRAADLSDRSREFAAQDDDDDYPGEGRNLWDVDLSTSEVNWISDEDSDTIGMLPEPADGVIRVWADDEEDASMEAMSAQSADLEF